MNMKKITTITIACLLVLGIFAGAVAAIEKEEVVYVNLTASGDVKDVNVVNIFEPVGPQYLIDYGEYESVKNLTSTEAILQTGDEIKVYVDSGRFFYQGNMGTTEIPWDINISYFLDGHIIKPENIAGKSGHVTIVLDICRNEKFPDTYFYKNLGVQATVLLNATDCWNIVAPGAVIANNGKNKQLSYTILPNKGGVYNISFDTQNFEMQSITINGIIMNMDIKVDLSEAKDMMRTLGNATSSLSSGADSLSNGAYSLSTGVSRLFSGWASYVNNTSYKELYTNLFPGEQQPELTVENYNVLLNKLGDRAKELFDNGELTEDKYKEICASIESIRTLLNSTSQINSGAATLSSGASTLASGADMLASRTSGLDKTVQSMVDKILDPIRGGDGYRRSFTSVKNVDVKSIQFAMHTDPIEITEEAVIEEVKKELSVWEQFLKLFGLYKEE